MRKFGNKKLGYTLAEVSLGLLSLALAGQVWAQDDEEPGWQLTGELSLVTASGNSETSTVGLQLGAVKSLEGASFELELGGLQAESTTLRRRAVGTPDDFELIEDKTTETTAENSFLRGRYQRDISERLFWFVGAGWERNEFAGFENRYSAVGGIGRLWLDSETAHFRTDVGLTYTQQDNLVDSPGVDDGFLGLRLGYDYWRQVTTSSKYESKLIVDVNADETDDLRADFYNALAVSMNEWLALKVSLQLLFDNQPSLTTVPLEDVAGVPTGQSAVVELDDLDTVFKVSMVVTR